MTRKTAIAILRSSPLDLSTYEDLYRHLHSHPELSNQERETSKTISSHLPKSFQIHTGIGGHGLAGVLQNGSGKVVMLRSDMDALPIAEKTSLPYASVTTMSDPEGLTKPVMHACGHDMHMTCLLAAAETLVNLREEWSGTLIVLFQPAEERGTGAQAMVDDGLYDKIPIPDYVLGQHVMAMRAGNLGLRTGTLMAAADSMKITLFGKGGHGSQPHRTIDPALMAAHVVVRLQDIVSREVDPNDVAVVTVGSLQAGQTENVISDEAEIGVDVRSAKPETREKLLSSVRRIVEAECVASNAPCKPHFVPTRKFPALVNDGPSTQKIATSFTDFFGNAFNSEIPITTVSEDFPILATSRDRPYVFWHFGGIDQTLWDHKTKEGRVIEDIPMNHSSGFAPVIQPTMRTGVDALCLAALTMLCEEDN